MPTPTNIPMTMMMTYTFLTRRILVAGTLLSVFSFFLLAGAAHAQEVTPEPVRVLQNKSFEDSEATRNAIIEAYEDLRVPDVADALDLIGLQDVTLFAEDIRPLWRDTDDFTHRVVGFALTARYVPSDQRVGTNSFDSIEDAQRWTGQQYGRAGENYMQVARPGDVLVVDQSGAPEGGHIGSMNSLQWAAEGLRGVITNGGTRDTDEIVMTKAIPVYTRYIARGIRPGRILLDSYNVPINCGGVLVYPGDLIVADGDGIISVPRERALEVAHLAREVMTDDQARRARLYRELGLPIDDTVREYMEQN